MKKARKFHVADHVTDSKQVILKEYENEKVSIESYFLRVIVPIKAFCASCYIFQFYGPVSELYKLHCTFEGSLKAGSQSLTDGDSVSTERQAVTL
jgi:hypothetical protein